MGWVWSRPPLPYSRPNYLNLFPIPIPNPGRDGLMCPVPVYNRLDNLIPVPNVFSGRGKARVRVRVLGFFQFEKLCDLGSMVIFLSYSTSQWYRLQLLKALTISIFFTYSTFSQCGKT